MNDIKLYGVLQDEGGPRIASRICGPAEGVTVTTERGRRLAPPKGEGSLASLSLPVFPLLYLALTLLRGNLLINSQLVSAARRLINRVARWRHAQNPPSAPRFVRVVLKYSPDCRAIPIRVVLHPYRHGSITRICHNGARGSSRSKKRGFAIV